MRAILAAIQAITLGRGLPAPMDPEMEAFPEEEAKAVMAEAVMAKDSVVGEKATGKRYGSSVGAR